MNYDTLRQLFEQIRDERRTAANTAQRIGVAFLSLLDSIRDLCSGIFLRKDQPDTAQETITFQKGTKFGTYTTGPLGTGGAVVIDQAGNSTAEFDYITIRKAATFRELTIKELRHVGGEIVLSAAAMKCSKVEPLDPNMLPIAADSPMVACYKCYFDTHDAEGNQQVFQEFVQDDLARCQTFGTSTGESSGYISTRYYWRKVLFVGEDYIILGNGSGEKDDDCTSAPAVGDNIVQLGYVGNDNDKLYRQSAIILSATDTDAPSMKFYQGINSFALPTPVKDEGYDPETGVFHSNVYGDFYVGDENGHVSYDSQAHELEIKGKVQMTANSTVGDTNIKNALETLTRDVADAAGAASDAQSAADNAQTAADNAQTAAETAKDAADVADERIDNLSTGNENLVVNGGFTGMFTSESVEDASFNADSEIYSEPFGKWPTHTGCSIVSRSASATGKACQMSSGRLEQTISRGINNGQPYTLSLLGLSTGTITVSIGGFSKTISLDTGVRNVEKFEASSTANTLVITGTGIITEIQLIEGNVKLNGWTPSPEDNNKYLGYYKNLAYLMEAMADGNTDIIGGLILTMMIRVGNHLNQQMVGETGGMSGIYNNDDDPFLWGGGTMTQALAAIRFFADDPMADPSEQLANMAKFVVTHGGRAILNDVILNNVYARGQINATSGKVGGFVIDGHALKNKRSGYNPSISEPSTIDNTAYDPEAVIILENPAKGAYVSVGTNVLPPSLGGSRALVELLSSKDNYEQTDGVNLAMIVGATNALQNIAIAITGGCITNLAVKTAEYGWGTYVTSATDTTPALTRLIAKEACDVFATTEYNWRASDSGSYQKKTRNVYLTLPDMEMCDDGHIIKIKRGPNDGGEFHVIPGRSTYLVNGVPTWSQSVILSEHSDTWCYPTNDNSHDYRLYNEGRGCELVYHRDMTVTISGTTYHGVWIEHKFPRDW